MEPGRVMVVENDRDILDIVRDVLEGHGYAVTCAPDGAQAFAAIAAGVRPALILLDLTMPVMDGFEFLARKQADPAIADVPVIAMTAVRDLPPADRMGLVAVIRKPMTLPALLAIVERFCPSP